MISRAQAGKRPKNPSRTVSHASNWKSGFRWLTLLCFGIVLGSAGIDANAATTIYLYDANGSPIDVTASYTYQQNYVYDSLANVVGTVDSNGYIYDQSMQVIGYLQTDPVPPH